MKLSTKATALMVVISCGLTISGFGEAPKAATSSKVDEREWKILYDTARELYGKKKYYGAKMVFLQISEVTPNYRLVPEYLSAITLQLAAKSDPDAQAKNRAKLKELYQKARGLYRKKNYLGARDKFREVVRIDPGYSSAESLLDRAEQKLKEQGLKSVTSKPGKKPDPTAKSAGELSPAREKELTNLLDQAYQLESEAKVKNAIPLVEKALKIDPDNARARRQMARLLANEGEPVAAKAKKPSRSKIRRLENQADGLYKEGKFKEARAVYSQLLDVDYNNRLAAAMMSMIDKKMGGEGKAKGLDPDSADVIYHRARLSRSRGDEEHAIDLLVTLLSQQPDHTEAKALLNRIESDRLKASERAKSAGMKKKKKSAEKERLIARATEIAEELKILAQLREWIREGKNEEVINQTETLLAERPDWEEVQDIRHMALNNLEALKERIVSIESKIKDRKALNESRRASLIPDEQAPILRPEIRVEPMNMELKTIQEKLQQKVSVNLVEADLSYVLDLLFRATGINIVANPQMLADQQITIHVEQIPLQDLLEYISRNFGIHFSATRSAIWVSTPDQPFMETQIRYLKIGLSDVAEQAESTTSDVEKLLERVPELMEWPDGSAHYLDRKRNVLFLRSTPEALLKVNELLDAVDVNPLQILIETRFIEIRADDFKDVDIDFQLLSEFGILKKGGANKVQIDADSQPELGPGIGGLRPGDSPAPNASGQVDGVDLTITGVLTDPQFQILIKAIEDTQRSKTLSAPRILALNNYTAEIEIVQDLIYIENFEVDRADISGTTVGVVDDQTGAGNLSSEPILVPEFAEGQEIGFRLKVTPSVGDDHKNISLVIEPEITEQIDQIDFELTIQGLEGDPPTITRPIISTRTLSTKATVADGSVLVIAGLMRHNTAYRMTKIPFLGDIPYLGQLFRREGEFDIRSNLIIFVKATIIDGEGRRYFDLDQEGTNASLNLSPKSAGQNRLSPTRRREIITIK